MSVRNASRFGSGFTVAARAFWFRKFDSRNPNARASSRVRCWATALETPKTNASTRNGAGWFRMDLGRNMGGRSEAGCTSAIEYASQFTGTGELIELLLRDQAAQTTDGTLRLPVTMRVSHNWPNGGLALRIPFLSRDELSSANIAFPAELLLQTYRLF